MSLPPIPPAGSPFVLLDDARVAGAADARLYREPQEIVVARRPEDVLPAFARLAELADEGHHLAGMLSYEAGLALEPRLAPLLAGRTGEQPLLWFGAFCGHETIPTAEVAPWLHKQRGDAPAAIGPLEPQISPGAYRAAFAGMQSAIAAGDIYQANLTFPLAGSWSGSPLALYAALRPHASAGYGSIVHDGAGWLLSFSPELLFDLHDGALTVRPMKGTRPRSEDAATDEMLRSTLAASIKDRAENLISST